MTDRLVGHDEVKNRHWVRPKHCP